MRRHIPGLHSRDQNQESHLQGLFLVRVDGASYRWHPHKPFFSLRFVVEEPESFATRSFSGRLYCSERALGSSIGSCGILATTLNFSAAIKWTRSPPESSRRRAHLAHRLQWPFLSEPRILRPGRRVGGTFLHHA